MQCVPPYIICIALVVLLTVESIATNSCIYTSGLMSDFFSPPCLALGLRDYHTQPMTTKFTPEQPLPVKCKSQNCHKLDVDMSIKHCFLVTVSVRTNSGGGYYLHHVSLQLNNLEVGVPCISLM